MRDPLKIVVVAGARPNFMKVAPLVQAMRRYPQLDVCLVHTGQHYDFELSKIFFNELGIPRPAYELGVGSASHATQTAEIMKRFEPVCLTEKPDLVIVRSVLSKEHDLLKTIRFEKGLENVQFLVFD